MENIARKLVLQINKMYDSRMEKQLTNKIVQITIKIIHFKELKIVNICVLY
jgi:hypothetical protein